MFSNFKDAFIRRPQFTIKTPDAVIDMMGKGLPEGFRYTHDHDGFYRLECDGIMNITPTKVNLPKEAKLLFEGKKLTASDLMEYAYNSQTQIELLPDDNGCFIVNGEKINASDFMIAPLKGLEFSKGQLFIVPPEFPAPFPIELSGNGYSITVMVQRQPVHSITSASFSSIGETAISIDYTLDLTEETIQFNVNTHLSNSASQVLASKEIFNALIAGNGTICGQSIPSIDENQDKMVSKETLLFWHRIVDVETVLGIKFNVEQEIDLDDINFIYALHRSFIENKPFKKYLTNLKLSGNGEFDEISANAQKTPIGKEILFEYTEDFSLDLLGVSLDLYSIASIFNCVVSEIDLPPDGTSGAFSVNLKPASGKRMFSSTQYFLNHDSVKELRADKNHVSIFQEAEELDI